MRNSSEADFKFIDSVAARWWVIFALFFSCALLGWTWLSPPISNDLWRILIASRWAGFQVVCEETLFELPQGWNWKLAKLALEFVALLGKNVFKRMFSAFFVPTLHHRLNSSPHALVEFLSIWPSVCLPFFLCPKILNILQIYILHRLIWNIQISSARKSLQGDPKSSDEKKKSLMKYQI